MRCNSRVTGIHAAILSRPRVLGLHPIGLRSGRHLVAVAGVLFAVAASTLVAVSALVAAIAVAALVAIAITALVAVSVVALAVASSLLPVAIVVLSVSASLVAAILMMAAARLLIPIAGAFRSVIGGGLFVASVFRSASTVVSSVAANLVAGRSFIGTVAIFMMRSRGRSIAVSTLVAICVAALVSVVATLVAIGAAALVTVAVATLVSVATTLVAAISRLRWAVLFGLLLYIATISRLLMAVSRIITVVSLVILHLSVTGLSVSIASLRLLSVSNLGLSVSNQGLSVTGLRLLAVSNLGLSVTGLLLLVYNLRLTVSLGRRLPSVARSNLGLVLAGSAANLTVRSSVAVDSTTHDSVRKISASDGGFQIQPDGKVLLATLDEEMVQDVVQLLRLGNAFSLSFHIEPVAALIRLARGSLSGAEALIDGPVALLTGVASSLGGGGRVVLVAAVGAHALGEESSSFRRGRLRRVSMRSRSGSNRIRRRKWQRGRLMMDRGGCIRWLSRVNWKLAVLLGEQQSGDVAYTGRRSLVRRVRGLWRSCGRVRPIHHEQAGVEGVRRGLDGQRHAQKQDGGAEEKHDGQFRCDSSPLFSDSRSA